ncbi:MAG TPA: hypothetical protein VMA09_08475 [Candidatus Binataceae bacterium]|nr:hypothetical protein [Candidatus Binataceae bacterium]
MAAIGAFSLTIVGCAQMMNSLSQFVNPEAQANPEESVTGVASATAAAMPTISSTELPMAIATSRATARSKAKTARPSLAIAKPPSSMPSETTVDSPEATNPPVVTLAEPADAAVTAPQTSTASPVAASSLALASPDGVLRNKTEQMIRDVNAEARQVDEKNLTADQLSSETLATRLLRSAEKSFDDQDYSAADSLAAKASALLRSLPMSDNSTAPHK